eukprot:g3128.t1
MDFESLDFSVSNSQEVTAALLQHIDKEKRREAKACTPRSNRKRADTRARGAPKSPGAQRAARLLESAASSTAASEEISRDGFAKERASDAPGSSSARKPGGKGTRRAAKGKQQRRRRAKPAERDADLFGDSEDDSEMDEEETIERAAAELVRSAKRSGGGNRRRGGGNGADRHLKDLERSHPELARKRPVELRLLASFLACSEDAEAEAKKAAQRKRDMRGAPVSKGPPDDCA